MTVLAVTFYFAAFYVLKLIERQVDAAAEHLKLTSGVIGVQGKLVGWKAERSSIDPPV